METQRNTFRNVTLLQETAPRWEGVRKPCYYQLNQVEVNQALTNYKDFKLFTHIIDINHHVII
jgi:hypothetical protein